MDCHFWTFWMSLFLLAYTHEEVSTFVEEGLCIPLHVSLHVVHIGYMNLLVLNACLMSLFSPEKS